MPDGDRTGPAGWGPMGGRAARFCAGSPVPGHMNPVWGRGALPWGGKAVGGRGFRNRFFATGLAGWQRAGGGSGCAPMGPEQEKAFLHDHVQSLEKELKRAQERIAELQQGGEQK
jgi:hypothetical protein